jgi:hypothetical protein
MNGDDWLEPESEDWLSPDVKLPAVSVAPDAIPIPVTYGERLKALEAAWSQLSVPQRQFLEAWRECRFNTSRVLREHGGVAYRTVMTWGHYPPFAFIRAVWLSEKAGKVMDRDRLLARQDDLVETLMTPKPILHQGIATGHEEVEAGAAARANETLMKAAGLLKEEKIDVNVGLVGPSFIVQVVQPNGVVVDVSPKYVPVELPEPDGN